MSEVHEYSDPRPGSKIGKVRIALMRLHKEHDSAGMLPTSCRFLFYELVARKISALGVHQAVETEALSQPLIIDIVRGWLDSLLPQPLEQILVSERQQREQLRRLINRAHRR